MTPEMTPYDQRAWAEIEKRRASRLTARARHFDAELAVDDAHPTDEESAVRAQSHQAG
jgi:hypothetical protein